MGMFTFKQLLLPHPITLTFPSLQFKTLTVSPSPTCTEDRSPPSTYQREALTSGDGT